MLNTTLARPSVALQPYVWCYGQSTGRVEQELVVPLPARPKQLLSFFLGDVYGVRPVGLTRWERSPAMCLVGPQTHHRIDLSILGNIDTFTIHFQPAGFHHLFGVPMRHLTNASVDAECVVGRVFQGVRQQLADCPDFAARIAFVECLLLGRLRNAGRLNPIGASANRLFASDGRLSVDSLARLAYLDTRQFERRFLEQVGTSPKLYGRIIRFTAALDRKLKSPHRTWTDIAHELNYHDHMHMVHDFQSLAGDSPARFTERLDVAPALRTLFASGAQPTIRR
jgi:AraC-like DNA-binding protein